MVGPRGMEIVRRAYELWERAGKPEGMNQDFYHQVERELRETAEAIEKISVAR